MNKIIRLLIATPMIISLISCNASSGLISRMSNSERTDAFTEVPAGGAVPSGYADVVIKASLKTPMAGYYLLESKESSHGKAVYPFLINIDGQAVLWQVEGRKHVFPKYVDDKTSHDPEAGEGMKYMLEKNVRLAAGSHRLFLGLPEESYYATADISVKSGGLYVLEFKPEYRYKTEPTRIPTFLKGINKYEIYVNEERVN